MCKHHPSMLTICEVVRRTGLSPCTIYRKIRDGSFPRQVKVGIHASRWPEAEITAWIQARLDARDVTPTKPKPQK